MDQPFDWEPEPEALYQCSECDVLFAHPQALLFYGDWIYACPECHSHDFYTLAYEVVYGLFWHIIAHDFSEHERMNLRLIAEMKMGPYDPANRRR